jgi:glycogen debranching enzyme
LLRYRHIPGAVALAERLALVLLDAAEVFGGRLPELYWGLARSQFSSPVPYPTSCSPQAWASAAPLLLRSFLGLAPHVPHKKVTVCPLLPTEWGRVTLTDLRPRRYHGAFRSRGRDSEDPRRARRLATADGGLLMLMCH